MPEREYQQAATSARSNASSNFQVRYPAQSSLDVQAGGDTPNDSFYHMQLRMQQQFGGGGGGDGLVAVGGRGSLYAQQGGQQYIKAPPPRSSSVSSRDSNNYDNGGNRRGGSQSRSAMQNSYRRLAGGYSVPQSPQNEVIGNYGTNYRNTGAVNGPLRHRTAVSSRVGVDGSRDVARSSATTSRSHTPLTSRPPFSTSTRDHGSNSKRTPSTVSNSSRGIGGDSRPRRGTPTSPSLATFVGNRNSGGSGVGGLSSSLRSADYMVPGSAPSTARSVPSHVSFAAARNAPHPQHNNSNNGTSTLNVASMLKNIAELASQIAHQAVSAEHVSSQNEQLAITNNENSSTSQQSSSPNANTAAASALKAQEIERIVRRVEAHYSSKMASITEERDEALAKVALLEQRIEELQPSSRAVAYASSNNNSPIKNGDTPQNNNNPQNLQMTQKQLQIERQQRMLVEEQSQKLSESHSRTVAGLEERIRRQERQIRDLYTTLALHSGHNNATSAAPPDPYQKTLQRNSTISSGIQRNEISPPPSPADDDGEDSARFVNLSQSRRKQQLDEEARVVSEARRQSLLREYPQNPKVSTTTKDPHLRTRSPNDAESWLSPPQDGEVSRMNNNESPSGINGTPKQSHLQSSADKTHASHDPSPLTKVLRDLADDKEYLLDHKNPNHQRDNGHKTLSENPNDFQIVEMSMQRAASSASATTNARATNGYYRTSPHNLQANQGSETLPNDDDVEEDDSDDNIIVVKGIHGQPDTYINTTTGETTTERVRKPDHHHQSEKHVSSQLLNNAKRPSTPTPQSITPAAFTTTMSGALHRLTPRSVRATAAGGSNSATNTPVHHHHHPPRSSGNDLNQSMPENVVASSLEAASISRNNVNQYYGDSDDDPDVAAAFSSVATSKTAYQPVGHQANQRSKLDEGTPSPQPKISPSTSKVHNYRSADAVDVVEDVTAFLEGLNKELQALDTI